MSANDDLNSLKGSDGLIPYEAYLKYINAHAKQQYEEQPEEQPEEQHEEQFALLEIHLTERHIYQGRMDDPCLCPLALAIKDALECEWCTVWRDEITIDCQTYTTTDDMKLFIDYFDRYGCVETAARFLGKRPADVFRIPIKQNQLQLKKHEPQDLDPDEILELDGIDPQGIHDEDEPEASNED